MGSGAGGCGNSSSSACGDGDGEHLGALGIVALPGTCCVCIEVEQINNCLHSEKICILPILACLLSLALCTAGLKWVFVDKIFEYEPPTHLDPKPIGQDPIIISVDPTLGLTVSIPHSSKSTVSLTTAIAITPGRPEVVVEEKSTRGPYVPQTTTSTAKTSSHVTRCSDSQKNYCVNGGECFTLEIMPGSTKCPNEFTGDRCQNYVMASFYKHLGIEFMEAEELYQKRILTISGICIALLVVGIMCVVAYCKTKKQRKKLHDRLRQSLRNKRNHSTKTGTGPNLASSARGRQISNLPLQDLQLINQCNGISLQHAAEKETETTFSTSKYALSAHEATTLTHISSQSWSNDWTNSVVSDTESVSVMSLAEKSHSATQGGRGRLNATGGTRDLSARSKTICSIISLFRESFCCRFVSAMTTPTQLSPVSQTSPATPGSPPSEMSAPLSSLAISVPSVALSPSGEEERPLLLSNRRQPHNPSKRDDQKRTSAHYNYGHVAHSLPPSPLFTTKDVNYTGNHDDTAASHEFSASPEQVIHTNNNISDCSTKKRAAVPNGHVLRHEEPLLTTDSTAALKLRALDSSRTNPAAPHDDMRVRSFSSTQQHPVAV
uniref:Neuregulin 1 n=1 Tax=Seriola dumerili TaxID=41447 RepID=A0A3B4VEX7_SERDU